MRYTVRLSYIDVLGYIWMPNALCSLRITLTAFDLDNMREPDGLITRESIADWLTVHTGDFREVVDFSASIEDGNVTVDFPWSSKENEMLYFDTVNEEADPRD